MPKTLNFLTYLFHPIVIPIFTTLIYFYFTRQFFDPIEMVILSTQIIIVTFALPACIYILLKSLRLIEPGIMLSETSQRILPFSINIILLLFLKYWVLADNSAYELNIYLWGLTDTYILLLVCTLFKSKPSVHVAMLCNSIFFIVYLNLQYHEPTLILLITSILITATIASQRLYSKAHSSMQIILGAIVGILPQLTFIALL